MKGRDIRLKFAFRRFRWLKNGQLYDHTTLDDGRIAQQPGKGTLVFTKPRDQDAGQYQCFAENLHGVAASNSVFVRKSTFESSGDESIKTLTAKEGEPFKLECRPPTATPKLQIRWLIKSLAGGIKSINNPRITCGPDGNLWFSNVTNDDVSNEFYYACAVASTFRNEYKIQQRVLLSITPTSEAHQYPMTFQYANSYNLVALRGHKTELFCIYGGTPQPQIRWTRNEVPIKLSKQITEGNHGKSLIIQSTSAEDAGMYRCIASNGGVTEITYAIALTVQSIPYFTAEPRNQNTAEGETIEFNCKADGIPAPTIKWIHNGKPLAAAAANERRYVTPNKVVIMNVLKSDTGNYGCNASNALGYVYKEAYVNVLEPMLEVEQFSAEFSAKVDEDFVLTCRHFGVPKPKVTWLRMGMELNGSSRYEVLENGDIKIKRLQFADAGDYICRLENKFSVEEAKRSLQVDI